ncbi:MAG: SH3 domain-containing protein [Anaerolineae bacterium]|nr:SH3 domain-containing protein [Anaerolineae bacterium]
MALRGKGLWAYQRWELTRALSIAPEMDVTHILYKVGQGPRPGKAPWYIDNAAELAQLIRNAGFIPMAWSFTTLADPDFEAHMVVRALNDGYEGFIFNAEDESGERRQQAIQMGNHLQNAGVDLTKLYLCSYPTPITHHPDIPYNEMGPYCRGGLMPMAYGTYLLPPDIVIDRWTYEQNTTWMQQQGLQLPIHPVLGPQYDEFGQQPMPQAEFKVWLDHLTAHHPTFFSVYASRTVIPEHYALVRAFELGPGDEPGGVAWVKDLGGGVLLGTPGKTGTEKKGLMYGTQVVILGPAVVVNGVPWQQVKAGTAQGWMRSDGLANLDPGPWPPLAPPPTPEPGHLVTVWNIEDLNTRNQPVVKPETLVGRIPAGARLRIVQDTHKAGEWVGKPGRWLKAQVEPDGPQIWVAAWYLTSVDPHAPVVPGLNIQVHSPEVGFLNIRSGPGTSHPKIAEVLDGAVMHALEPDQEVRNKIGQTGEWLHVLTPEGLEGYAAAWHLMLFVEGGPEKVRYVIVDSGPTGLFLRESPSPTAQELLWVADGIVLESLEDPGVTGSKIGQPDTWLEVRSPSRRQGFVPAWHLKAPEQPDERRPVVDTLLPLGFSAWVFGMHAAGISDDTASRRQRIRQLFESKGKRGWVLFTEGIGADPNVQFNPELRTRLWDWAAAGYGVVVRLNYSYFPTGTLPVSSKHEQFAATCARWVELYLKHEEEPANRYTWVIQIANEQNNPKEHPRDDGHNILENITPKRYAQAFNQAYARIKAVLPQAMVAPGAIDPYNSQHMHLVNKRYRPLDYFKEMLDNIPELDAIMLHAYTHGPSVDAITALTTFGDGFLSDHYFHFQTYRQFMERIPAKWRNVPVIIGESNHICRPPSAPVCDKPEHQGWINTNIGWVRAAYEELQRWNSMPYSQQIAGLLLYRWVADQWELYNKEQIHNDFMEAMNHDYRWRA